MQPRTNSISYLVPDCVILYVFEILMIAWIFIRRGQIAGLSTNHTLRAIILAGAGAIIGAEVA